MNALIDASNREAAAHGYAAVWIYEETKLCYMYLTCTDDETWLADD